MEFWFFEPPVETNKRHAMHTEAMTFKAAPHPGPQGLLAFQYDGAILKIVEEKALGTRLGTVLPFARALMTKAQVICARSKEKNRCF